MGRRGFPSVLHAMADQTSHHSVTLLMKSLTVLMQTSSLLVRLRQSQFLHNCMADCMLTAASWSCSSLLRKPVSVRRRDVSVSGMGLLGHKVR